MIIHVSIQHGLSIEASAEYGWAAFPRAHQRGQTQWERPLKKRKD